MSGITLKLKVEQVKTLYSLAENALVGIRESRMRATDEKEQKELSKDIEEFARMLNKLRTSDTEFFCTKCGMRYSDRWQSRRVGVCVDCIPRTQNRRTTTMLDEDNAPILSRLFDDENRTHSTVMSYGPNCDYVSIDGRMVNGARRYTIPVGEVAGSVDLADDARDVVDYAVTRIAPNATATEIECSCIDVYREPIYRPHFLVGARTRNNRAHSSHTNAQSNRHPMEVNELPF